MGKIRGLHTSPGVYTKMTALRRSQSINKTIPASTANISTGGGSADSTSRFYFGYMPVTSYNGEITSDSISEILELSGDEIKNMPTIFETRSSRPVIELTDGKDLLIPTELNEQSLMELLEQGEEYADIADQFNKCIVIMLPTYKYNTQNVDIIDQRFEAKINDKFYRINDVKVGKIDYVLLCMFNNLWGYSAVGDDKVMSPIKLVFELK